MAQNLAKKQHNRSNMLYYVATMIASDKEDLNRVKLHVEDRAGMGFSTLEIPNNISNLPNFVLSDDSILLDSTTALLANEMFMSGIETDAAKKIYDEYIKILSYCSNIVIVSDFIYSDSSEYDPLTENYRNGLAMLDKLCAQKCDIVLEACSGIFIPYKGADLYKTLV